MKQTYMSDVRAPKSMKQTLIEWKGEIDSSTVIVRNVNAQLSIMDRTPRQNISKETED